MSLERPGVLRLLGSALLASFAACGQARDDARLNVVLISIDSLRPDHLGCYGYRPEFAPDLPVSPNLDALARRGALFESAWTSSSWTLPGHMSLLTGLSAAAHGVELDDERLDPLRTTLAERFRAGGWATAGVFSGPYLDPRYGFDRGFDSYQSAMLPAPKVEELIERERSRRRADGRPELSDEQAETFRARFCNLDVTSPRATALAEQFIEANAARPFFLFVHYFDVHYDYVPDAEAPDLAQRFDPHYEGPFDGHNWYFDARVRDLAPPFERRIGERDLRHVLALYDAEVHFVDAHVGKLLAALDRAGLTRRTIVAVVSDHGEEFFEHAGIGHRNTLFTEVGRIPMLLAWPEGEHAGTRVRTPVSIQDMAPTLLESAGAPMSQDGDGASLRALMAGEEQARRGVFSRLYDPAPWFFNLREAWRDERYSVIRNFDLAGGAVRQISDPATGQRIFHVFDREADPAEQSALRPTDPRYRDAVARFCRDWNAEQSFLDGLAHSPPSVCTLPEEDPRHRAHLAALGYAELASEPSGRPPLVLPPPSE